jgi:hypothetical protein
MGIIYLTTSLQKFRDSFNVMWFAVVSVTTVGYGDMNPRTVAGRILTIFLMLTGIGLISTLSAFTGAVRFLCCVLCSLFSGQGALVFYFACGMYVYIYMYVYINV